MMKRHIRPIIFTLFFVVATISTALHELSPHHHSDTCPICIVDEHTLSADIVTAVIETLPFAFSDRFVFYQGVKRAEQCTSLKARAPPFFSLL